MMSLLQDILVKAYAQFLRLYPPGFRRQFAEEMKAVYSDAQEGAALQGWIAALWLFLHELFDLPAALLREHRCQLMRWEVTMEVNRSPQISRSDPPESWAGILAGAGLFLIAGPFLILNEIPLEWSIAAQAETLRGVAFIALILLPPLGFAVGWMRDFPRWSYPYTGLALLMSLYMTVASTPGLRFFTYTVNIEGMWGWRAWVPLLAAAALGFLVTRSFKPLYRFCENIARDSTCVSFGLFGVMPLVVFIAFDEMDRLYSLVFMIILTVLMIATAVAYLRSRSSLQRLASLAIGTLVTVGVTQGATTGYWARANGLSPSGLITTAMCSGIIILFMLAPALVGLLRRQT
jgi:hypothetical protein